MLMPGACALGVCRRREGSLTSPPRLRLPLSRIQLTTQEGTQMRPIPALWSSLRLTCSPPCRRTAPSGSVSHPHMTNHQHRSQCYLQDCQLPQAALKQPYNPNRYLPRCPSLLSTHVRKRKSPRLREHKRRTTLARV